VAASPGVAQGPPPTPVTVTLIEQRSLPDSMRLVGTVRAERAAVVAAEIAGAVASWEVDEGEYVRKGALLCALDDVPAQLRLAEARARLEALEAGLRELENGTRPEELRRAEALVAESQAMAEKLGFERDRVAGLFEGGRSNPKEMHDAEMEYIAARRRLAQEEATLELLRNGPRVELIERARHELAAQQALVRQAERDMDKTRVLAPFDGFVAEKLTEVGAWIAEGGPVCDLIGTDTVRVRVDVPEAAIRFSRPGAPATVEIEALERSFEARVSRVVPRATLAGRTFPVEVDLPNADHTVLPGMYAWVHVPAGPAGERLMVSRDAIVMRGREKLIYVLRPGPSGEMAMPVPVTTGLELSGMVEVSGIGLSAGDRAVSRANERLMGPSPVTVVSGGGP
jgi:multidrug efflux pump subunit AcrA (membrane-fusion protein)